MVLSKQTSVLRVVHQIGRQDAARDLIAEHLNGIGREVLDFDFLGLNHHVHISLVERASIVPEPQMSLTSQLRIGRDMVDAVEREVGCLDIDVRQFIDKRFAKQRLVAITESRRIDKEGINLEMLSANQSIVFDRRLFGKRCQRIGILNVF